MRRWVLLLALLTCAPGVSAQTLPSDLAENWRTSGKYFTWTSPLPENQGRTVQVFYTCIGDAAKPTVMMLHGFPTSSFDFRLLAHELEPDFRSCMLDFPGYGLSDKPLAGYRYTLTDDAQLVWHFVTKVVPLQQFVLFSHDRGDSVALNLLQLYVIGMQVGDEDGARAQQRQPPEHQVFGGFGSDVDQVQRAAGLDRDARLGAILHGERARRPAHHNLQTVRLQTTGGGCRGLRGRCRRQGPQ